MVNDSRIHGRVSFRINVDEKYVKTDKKMFTLLTLKTDLKGSSVLCLVT